MDRDAEALKMIKAFFEIDCAETRQILLTLAEAAASGAIIKAIAPDKDSNKTH